MDDQPSDKSVTFYLNEEEEEEDTLDRIGSEEKCGKPRIEQGSFKAGQKFTRDELI